MIFIWGSTGLTSTVSSGRFYCPRCDDPDCDYDLKATRRWFTFFFIPIFPISGKQQYVECRHCRQAFEERVLDLAPPTPDEPDQDEVNMALEEMHRRASVEKTAGRLDRLGLSRAETDRLIDKATGGRVWHCDRCDSHYVEGVKPCPQCG